MIKRLWHKKLRTDDNPVGTPNMKFTELTNLYAYDEAFGLSDFKKRVKDS